MSPSSPTSSITSLSVLILNRYRYFGSITSQPLFQFRNFLGHSTVSAKPDKALNQCDDFFELIVVCHMLAAAIKYLKMISLLDVPQIDGVQQPQNLWMEPDQRRKEMLQSICEKIVSEFISFEFNKVPKPSTDKVSFCIVHACNVIRLCYVSVCPFVCHQSVCPFVCHQSVCPFVCHQSICPFFCHRSDYHSSN